jgi:hypothetical protein
MSSMEELKLDAESGISKEDQQDILKEIENVATRNRIVTKAEDFVVKAMKRGILFPSMVIAAAAAALIVGGAAFYFLFQKGETQIVRGAVGTITAEGQLIEAVRKDADSRIQEKNLEINGIQSRLQEIDKQRQDLQANMDAKVGEKEAALKAQMAAALLEERDRLQKQGLSQQAIAQRMALLEKQRNAQLQRDMDVFKRQAEAQRQQAEQNLKTLQQDFTANLAKANAERQQAISDAQAREQELKGQFAQKTQALESATAQAQAALNAISVQRQKEDLVTGQLIGLYAIAQDDISQRNYDKALASLQSLKQFVERTDVASLPAIQRRHEFDEFVIDSLTTYVQEEIVKARTDTASLLEAANELTALRGHVTSAQALVRQGKAEEASREFDSAIQTIPEVAASYAYFVGRDREAEAARQARLKDALDRAEGAINAGSYAAAAASYRAALAYLPVPSERLDRAVANLQSVGVAIGSQAEGQKQSRAAGSLLSQADAQRSAGKFEDALAGYVGLLGQYPLAAQSKDALKGIQAAVKGLNDGAAATLRQREQELTSQVNSLQKELAARSADVASLQGSGTTQKSANAKLLAQIDGLSAQLRDAHALAAKGQVSEQQREVLQERFDGLQKEYTAYTALEDPILKTKGDAGLMNTKGYFDKFFRSDAMQGTFPGLADRVKKYDQGFQTAGWSDALFEANNIVSELSRQATPALKRAYLQSQLKAYSRDPDMVKFLQGMEDRLAAR